MWHRPKKKKLNIFKGVTGLQEINDPNRDRYRHITPSRVCGPRMAVRIGAWVWIQ